MKIILLNKIFILGKRFIIKTTRFILFKFEIYNDQRKKIE